MCDFMQMQMTVTGLTATVYKCPLLLLPLWHMPLWHQVAHATAISSGIISLWSHMCLYSIFFPSLMKIHQSMWRQWPIGEKLSALGDERCFNLFSCFLPAHLDLHKVFWGWKVNRKHFETCNFEHHKTLTRPIIVNGCEYISECQTWAKIKGPCP